MLYEESQKGCQGVGNDCFPGLHTAMTSLLKNRDLRVCLLFHKCGTNFWFKSLHSLSPKHLLNLTSSLQGKPCCLVVTGEVGTHASFVMSLKVSLVRVCEKETYYLFSPPVLEIILYLYFWNIKLGFGSRNKCIRMEERGFQRKIHVTWNRSQEKKSQRAEEGQHSWGSNVISLEK